MGKRRKDSFGCCCHSMTNSRSNLKGHCLRNHCHEENGEETPWKTLRLHHCRSVLLRFDYIRRTTGGFSSTQDFCERGVESCTLMMMCDASRRTFLWMRSVLPETTSSTHFTLVGRPTEQTCQVTVNSTYCMKIATTYDHLTTNCKY